MSNALARPAPIRVEDYLEGETLTDIQHIHPGFAGRRTRRRPEKCRQQ